MGLLQIGIAALGLATFSRHEHGFLQASAPQLRSAVLAAAEHVSLITRNSHSEAH